MLHLACFFVDFVFSDVQDVGEKLFEQAVFSGDFLGFLQSFFGEGAAVVG